jgi:hypothetical protein
MSIRASFLRLHRGTHVAAQAGMTDRQAEAAVMHCRMCGGEVRPDADSTLVIAWYTCPVCDVTWSARLRDGRPERPHAVDEAWISSAA